MATDLLSRPDTAMAGYPTPFGNQVACQTMARTGGHNSEMAKPYFLTITTTGPRQTPAPQGLLTYGRDQQFRCFAMAVSWRCSHRQTTNRETGRQRKNRFSTKLPSALGRLWSGPAPRQLCTSLMILSDIWLIARHCASRPRPLAPVRAVETRSQPMNLALSLRGFRYYRATCHTPSTPSPFTSPGSLSSL